MTLPELLNLYKLALGCEPANVYMEYPMQGALPGDPIRAEMLSRRHIRWMLDCLPAIKESEESETIDSVSKFNRWLGFIQGVLWMTGEYSLDQLRAHIRELQ